MFDKRIKTLASYVSVDDEVLDVGTDHGYLSIYLKKNNLCKEVYASDISANALKNAQNNFIKYKLDIKTFVSDGFKNIPVPFNTAVIAGMGTNTILNILNNGKCPNKLVLSSNNNFYELRKGLNKLGYKIEKESIVIENNHYYIVLQCFKDKQRLPWHKLYFGISNNKDYYKFLYKKNKELYKKVPLAKKIVIICENIFLNILIGKK